MAYQKSDLEYAMQAMWELLEKLATPEQREALKFTHPCIQELDDYGPNGPVGLGLGVIGGHAVGEE